MPEINLDTAKATAKKAADSFKSAGSLVAKNAERTRIVTVTLPRAYAELGKVVYKNSSRRQEFAELFKAADDLLAQRKTIQEASQSRPSGSGIAERAKKAAADATDLAKAKAIDLQAFRAFAKLGEAAYQKHGSDSGPSGLVEPIANAVAKRDQLDRDLNAIDSASKGKWVTPKRVAWGVGLLLAVAVVSGIVNDAKNGESGSGRSTGNTAASARDDSAARPMTKAEFEKEYRDMCRQAGEAFNRELFEEAWQVMRQTGQAW